VVLLRKMTCNLRHLVSLRHPVSLSRTTHLTNCLPYCIANTATHTHCNAMQHTVTHYNIRYEPLLHGTWLFRTCTMTPSPYRLHHPLRHQHCNKHTLQYTATHCNIRYEPLIYGTWLFHECTTTHAPYRLHHPWRHQQDVSIFIISLHRCAAMYMCCSVLQCVAVWCSVAQCVAERCSVSLWRVKICVSSQHYSAMHMCCSVALCGAMLHSAAVTLMRQNSSKQKIHSHSYVGHARAVERLYKGVTGTHMQWDTHEWVKVRHMNKTQKHTYAWVRVTNVQKARAHTHRHAQIRTQLTKKDIQRHNESCHTCEWVMAHMRMSHCTHAHESWHTCEWVMATHMNTAVAQLTKEKFRRLESCGTCKYVTAHMGMSHDTHMSELWSQMFIFFFFHKIWTTHQRGNRKTGRCHKRYTCEWVMATNLSTTMSHMWRIHDTHVKDSWHTCK